MTQRTPKTWKEVVKQKWYLNKIKPRFLWRECHKCNNEFRREYGWVSNIHLLISLTTSLSEYQNYCGGRKYLCCRCAPTRGEAEEYFKGN